MTLMTDETRRARIGDLYEREMFFITRKRARISQAAVAEEAGMTQSYLSAWESGRWTPPDERQQAYWEALDRLLAARKEG